jgi:hypothetical protein
LCLFVKGMDRTYFDELEMIDKVLVPRNLSYVLLPPSAPFKEDAPVRLGAGHLIFEWPSELLDEVPRKWFLSPCIEIEGYIGKSDFLGQIARLYFEPDTELRIREPLDILTSVFGYTRTTMVSSWRARSSTWKL